MSPGSFIYPFSEYATPKEELAKRLGYQPDPAASIKEARALLAAAACLSGPGPSGAATDMFDLQPPRHISTLRISPVPVRPGEGPLTEPRAGVQFGGGNFLHACL